MGERGITAWVIPRGRVEWGTYLDRPPATRPLVRNWTLTLRSGLASHS